jgi:hypothetical protein
MVSKIASRLRNCSVVAATILALASTHSSLAQVATATSSEPPFGPNSRDFVTQTPIKHVIIIVGEESHFRPCLRHVCAGAYVQGFGIAGRCILTS